MPAETIQDVSMAFKKVLIDRALGGELSHHLGHAPGGDKPAEADNHRNGSTGKKVLPEDGPLRIEEPRDREGSFDPLLIAKYARRFTGFDDRIVAMYAYRMRGWTPPLTAEGKQPVVAALAAVRPQEPVPQDATLEENVELALDEPGQLGTGASLSVCNEAGRRLLHQAVQCGLLGKVAFALELCTRWGSRSMA
jgi:hypothetical protein